MGMAIESREDLLLLPIEAECLMLLMTFVKDVLEADFDRTLRVFLAVSKTAVAAAGETDKMEEVDDMDRVNFIFLLLLLLPVHEEVLNALEHETWTTED